MNNEILNDLNSEIKRLKTNETGGELRGCTLKKISVISKNITENVNQIKEVLQNIFETTLTEKKWPDLEKWKSIFSKDFINKFSPEMTDEEANEWLNRWQSLSTEEKAIEEKNRKWSFSNWIYWFEPDVRVWRWWRLEIIDDNKFNIEIVASQDVIPSGALEWLIKILDCEIIDI